MFPWGSSPCLRLNLAAAVWDMTLKFFLRFLCITVCLLKFRPLLVSERDTIRGVQIRAGAVYIYICMYGGTCAIIVVHATHT